MNMKSAPIKFFVITLFFTITIASLWAQTNGESGLTNVLVTNAAAPVAVDNSEVAKPSPAHVHVTGARTDGSSFSNESSFTQSLALMIPIVAIVMGCSIPIIIVGLSLYFQHRKNKMLHETVRAMVEKGVPIPPEMFQKTDRSPMERDKSGDKRPHNDVRSGLILTGIGFGVVMLCGKPGYIIMFLGVAFAVIGMLNLGKGNNNNDQSPKP
jgi:Domain of unknown function (DUF6249)